MKKQNSLCTSFIYFITAALVALVFFFGLTTGANTYAADSAVTSFDDTNVIDDLKAADFNLDEYSKDSNGELQVIYFVEYGYSIRVNEQENYALYIYVYNPAGINVDVNGKNFVQISSKRDENGKPTDYSKYSVKCVSTAAGKLFYKFKVVAGLSEQLVYVDDDARRYDVSGIELQTAGEANATEYPISTTFYYSGYAKGFGKDKTAESTLSCRSEELETIGLEVKHTTYKYQNAKNGGQEIASVYFNVPNEYFTDYGGLQKIKAEWLKAMTKDILVTNNQVFYDYLKAWIGKTTGSGSLDMQYYMYDADSKYTGNKFPASSNPNIYYSEFYMPWAYNVITFGNSPDFGGGTFGEYVNTFWWLFNGGTCDVKDITVSSETILDYYETFVNKSDLLLTVDEEKTVKEIDADDAFKIEGFDKNANLVNWLTKLLYPDIETSTLTGISPIQVLSSDDVKGTDEEVAKKLYVDKNDVESIKSFVNQSGSKTVLFRFAVSDYVNKEVVVCNRETGNNLGTNLVYRNRLPMYLDFDIIWLGFQKNGKLTIIPAVSSPTNIIGGTQPPVKDVIDKAEDWFKDLWDKIQSTGDKIVEVLVWIAAALILVLVLYVIFVIIRAIVKACRSAKASSKKNR